MTTIDRTTVGSLYLLHFSRPLGNLDNARGMARHYLGWALDAPARIACHLAGQSQVPIVLAALKAGIVITPHILGAAPKDGEWYLKNRVKNILPFCPDCCRQKNRRIKALPFSAWQLELPLFDADADFPAMPTGLHADSYEFLIRRNWRQSRPRETMDVSAFDTL